MLKARKSAAFPHSPPATATCSHEKLQSLGKQDRRCFTTAGEERSLVYGQEMPPFHRLQGCRQEMLSDSHGLLHSQHGAFPPCMPSHPQKGNMTEHTQESKWAKMFILHLLTCFRSLPRRSGGKHGLAACNIYSLRTACPLLILLPCGAVCCQVPSPRSAHYCRNT